jgi:hypothetical protein
MNRQRFNLIFNIVFAAVALIAGWLVPVDVSAKIQVEVVLLFVVLMAIYELQDQQFGKSGWSAWGSVMLLGACVLAMSLRLERVWTDSLSLALHGHLAEAVAYLDGRPHANLILFVGLGTLLVGVIGMIRLGLIRLLRLAET